MAERTPIYLETSPNRLREIPSGDTVDRSLLPLATSGSQGAVSGADKAKLDSLVAALQLPTGGSPGEVLAKLSGTDGDAAWVPPSAGSGSGDVVGPGSATDDALVRFNGVTGKLIQNGLVTLSDAGALAGITGINGRDPAADGAKLDAIPAGGTTSQVLAKVSGADYDLAWVDPATGSGDVVGPASATDNALARFDATTGKLLQDGPVTCSDAGAVAGVATLNGRDPADLVDDATNLSSTGADAPGSTELGLFTTKAGTELQLRSLYARRGLDAEVVGGSVRFGRRPSLWSPLSRSDRRRYRDIARQGVRTAGEQGDTAGLLDNHGASHLFPYMLWAGLDVNGFPHNGHKRLETTAMPNDSGEEGYEFGHDLAAGDFRDGRRLVFAGSGRCQNVGWDDAFWDWVLDINPTVAVYAGANRMRMVSPELGVTWSGERAFRYRVQLIALAAGSYQYHGQWSIYSAGGVLLKSWESGGLVDSGFDFLANDARVQLRWRVDRDPATRLDTFDATNQGANQGANVLRCSVRSYNLRHVGFGEG